MPLKCKPRRTKTGLHARSLAISFAVVLAAQMVAAQFAYGQGHQRGAWASSQGGNQDGAGPEPQPREQFGRRRQLEEGGNGDAGAFAPGQGNFRRRGQGRNLEGQGAGQLGGRSGGAEQGGAFGQGAGRRPGAAGGLGGGGAAGRRLTAIDFKKLGLSDEQKQRIRDMRSKNSGRARDLRQTLRDKRGEMRDLMFDPNATEAQIRGKLREVSRMQDQMENMQIDDFLSLRSVLTPEQRRHLPEIMPQQGVRQPGAAAGLQTAEPPPGSNQ